MTPGKDGNLLNEVLHSTGSLMSNDGALRARTVNMLVHDQLTKASGPSPVTLSR
jgi:hypothetical protein